MDIFGKEKSALNIEKMLVQEFHQSNHVSPEPPFPGAKASAS